MKVSVYLRLAIALDFRVGRADGLQSDEPKEFPLFLWKKVQDVIQARPSARRVPLTPRHPRRRPLSDGRLLPFFEKVTPMNELRRRWSASAFPNP